MDVSGSLNELFGEAFFGFFDSSALAFREDMTTILASTMKSKTGGFVVQYVPSVGCLPEHLIAIDSLHYELLLFLEDTLTRSDGNFPYKARK